MISAVIPSELKPSLSRSTRFARKEIISIIPARMTEGENPVSAANLKVNRNMTGSCRKQGIPSDLRNSLRNSRVNTARCKPDTTIK